MKNRVATITRHVKSVGHEAKRQRREEKTRAEEAWARASLADGGTGVLEDARKWSCGADVCPGTRTTQVVDPDSSGEDWDQDLHGNQFEPDDCLHGWEHQHLTRKEKDARAEERRRRMQEAMMIEYYSL
jgi:hypothetical protein